MRIAFTTLDRPRAVAKTLKTLLGLEGLAVSLSRARETTARLYGYGSWHELAGSTTPDRSPDDGEAGEAETERRRLFQIAALIANGVPQGKAGAVVDRLAPTAGRSTIAWTPLWDGEYAERLDTWIGRRLPGERPMILEGRGSGGGSLFDGPTHEECPVVSLLFPKGAVPARREDGSAMRAFASMAEAKAVIEGDELAHRRQLRENRRLGRRRIAFPDDASLMSPAMRKLFEEGPPDGFGWQSITFYAEGIILGEDSGHGYYHVDAAVIEAMPEPCRATVVDGVASYEEDNERALLILGRPQAFSDEEVEGARRSARQDYPGLLDILEGKVEATPEKLRRARRGFTEPKSEWGVPALVEERGDGTVLAAAKLLSYWGPEEQGFQARRHFVLPADVYDRIVRMEGWGMEDFPDLSDYGPVDVAPAAGEAPS